MAIDVSIKQSFFGNRPMPLEVILGESLHYGNFENDQLNVGVLGESQFIAYNPQSIGRGFSVVWNPKEKKNIALRLPLPSTTQELTDFYAAVERMARHWDAKLVVDGIKVSLDSFTAGFQDMVEFNNKVIKKTSQQILDGECGALTLYSAKWPLSIGKEEATLFLNNPNSYAEWLHEKQSMDVYFASPHFYMGDNGIYARYFLFSDLPSVFPNQPTVPLGVIDPATGKQLECKQWVLSLRILGETEALCEMEYSKFLSMVSDNKKSRYDEEHFLLSRLTEEEVKALSMTKESNMTKKQFFEIIMTVCDWDASDDDEKVLRPLIEYLAQQPDETIFSFDEIMAELLYELDTRKNFEKACEYDTHCDDTFLYSRCVALINGEEYYKRVKAGNIRDLWKMEFEAILYVPMRAWGKKHGKSPDDYLYRTTKSYETGSNVDGWRWY